MMLKPLFPGLYLLGASMEVVLETYSRPNLKNRFWDTFRSVNFEWTNMSPDWFRFLVNITLYSKHICVGVTLRKRFLSSSPERVGTCSSTYLCSNY